MVCLMAHISWFQLSESDDLDNDIDELLHDFELKCERPILHCVLFYWNALQNLNQYTWYVYRQVKLYNIIWTINNYKGMTTHCQQFI